MDQTATGAQLIELDGEYDLARKGELASHLSGLSNTAPVTIDMRNVTYVDSTFLGELASLRTRLENQLVTLLGAHPNVKRVLAITKLDRFFAFAD